MEKAPDKYDFSFADGGALLTFLRRHKYLGPDQPSLAFRISLLVLLTWVPLVILTALRGVAFGERVQIPFLYDLIQHARFLVALPLALWAEKYISPKFEMVLNRFVSVDIVPGEEIRRFEKAVSIANTVKDAVLVEVLLFGIAYLYMSLRLHRHLSPSFSTWADHAPMAAQWYLWVCMPVFVFVWLRWIWRQMIWTYLLFRISRLRLRLMGTHPDHAGGLAFVSVGQRRFAVLIFAISAIASASIGEEILFSGASLRSFELELVTFFVICILIVMGPLLVFTPHMIRAKLRDWASYALLAGEYSRGFDEKWIHHKKSANEELLGSPDIQSLSDMKNSFEGVSQMRTILPDRRTILILLIAYLLPLLPLLATVIPLRQILSELFKILSK